jgi:hypothetical protein
MFGALHPLPLHEFISTMVKFTLAVFQIITSPPLARYSLVCIVSSYFCKDWQHSTNVCGSVKRDESHNLKCSSQWAYECSSTEETHNRVTVKTSVQSVLQFHHNLCRSYIHEFKCILATPFILFYFSDKNDH